MGLLGTADGARQQLKGHLELLLMSILRGGPAHGYEIIVSLRERSEGAFDLPEGTVYPALHRLEQAGCLASDWTSHGGRRRRTYRLTDDGVTALATERASWLRFSTAIGSVLASGA
jgi:PadR family transcriptional regulator, regulatory protein PadR